MVRLLRTGDEDEWQEPKVEDTRPGGTKKLEQEEYWPIDLPSSPGEEYCLQHPDVTTLEAHIQVAHANDLLHRIQGGVVEKAQIFRTKLRSKSAKTPGGMADRTRGRFEIHKLGRTLRIHAQKYLNCRRAMEILQSPVADLQKFRTLTKEDLYTTTATEIDETTDTYNPRQPASFKVNLPWFWNLNIDHNATEDDMMAECE